MGRLSPLSGWLTSTCAHSLARSWQLSFLNQWKRKNNCRKYFIINLHKRMLPDPNGDQTQDLLITGWTCIQLSHQGQPERALTCNLLNLASEANTVKLVICKHHWENKNKTGLSRCLLLRTGWFLHICISRDKKTPKNWPFPTGDC